MHFRDTDSSTYHSLYHPSEVAAANRCDVKQQNLQHCWRNCANNVTLDDSGLPKNQHRNSIKNWKNRLKNLYHESVNPWALWNLAKRIDIQRPWIMFNNTFSTQVFGVTIPCDSHHCMKTIRQPTWIKDQMNVILIIQDKATQTVVDWWFDRTSNLTSKLHYKPRNNQETLISCRKLWIILLCIVKFVAANTLCQLVTYN